MRPKHFFATLSGLLISLIFTASSFAAKEPPKKRSFNPVTRKVVEYALPDLSASSKAVGQSVRSSNQGHSLGSKSISSSPGILIGDTRYDMQHANTTGRMVGIGQDISGTDTTTYVHFTWMTGSLPSPDGRTGAYVFGDLGAGMFSSEVQLTLGWAGFFNIDVTSDNRAVISGHYSPEGTSNMYSPTVWYDSAAHSSNFKYVAELPSDIFDCEIMPPGCLRPLTWPHLAFQTKLDGSHITHLTGIKPDEISVYPFQLYYFRKHGNSSDLSGGELSSCPTLSYSGWDCPFVYDTAWATVALVTASKQSGKVALTWTANLPDYSVTPGCDTCSVNESLGPLRNIHENDVYYQVSEDYGVTWNAMQNVTHNNASTANWMPYNDIDAMWDEDDKMHVAWVASDWERYRESGDLGYGARIYHWMEDYGNTIADTNARTSRLAVQRREDPILCNAGALNLNLAKPQLSECNGNLYCLFVDLWDGHHDPNNPDCPKRGYDGDWYGSVNGELMVSVSDNNGVSFDLPHNLTNSPTPNCDTVGGVVGPCDSDHWPSMPSKGFALSSTDDPSNWPKVNPRPQQSYPAVPGSEWLPVMYINDQTPGLTWNNDPEDIRLTPVRTFMMACVDPDQIGWGPEFCWGLGDEITWPTFTRPGVQLDVIKILENVGNSPVSYNLIVEEDTGPSGWLTVSPVFGSITNGPMNKDTVTIHLNTGGIINSNTVVYGRIILDQIDAFFACTLNVELIVNWFIGPPQIDTVSTGVISLAVANNGQFGMGGNAGQSCVRMDYFCGGDCDTVDSIPGNTEYYMYDGSIIVGGIVDGDTILSNQIFSQGYLQESSIYQLTPHTPPTTDGVVQYWRSGTLTNHDTTLGMEISYFAPQVTQTWGTVAGKTWHSDQQFITREFKVWSYDGQPHNDLAIGEVVDWDIPSDSGADNSGEADATRRLLYCIGGEYNQDDATECQDNDDRYGGMAFGYFKKFDATTNTCTIVDSVGYGGYHEANSRYVYPGWRDNQLYTNMESHPGYLPWTYATPDSAQTDLHSVLTYVFDYDLQPNDTLTFYSVLATVRDDPTGPTRIQDLASKGRNFTNYFGCCRGTRGDLNGDGSDCNILDLTFGVDRMFRGGPKSACAGEGDVNSDRSNTDILDITFMVDRIFRGGPPPRNCSSAPS